MKALLTVVLLVVSPAYADKDSKSATAARSVFANMTSGKGPLLPATKSKPLAYDLRSTAKPCKGLGGKMSKATDGPTVVKLRACVMATFKRLAAGTTGSVFEKKPSDNDAPEQKHVKTAPNGTVIVVGSWTTGDKSISVSIAIAPDDVVSGIWMDYEESTEE